MTHEELIAKLEKVAGELEKLEKSDVPANVKAAAMKGWNGVAGVVSYIASEQKKDRQRVTKMYHAIGVMQEFKGDLINAFTVDEHEVWKNSIAGAVPLIGNIYTIFLNRVALEHLAGNARKIAEALARGDTWSAVWFAVQNIVETASAEIVLSAAGRLAPSLLSLARESRNAALPQRPATRHVRKKWTVALKKKG